MIVLGVETSCDETAVAIVRDEKKFYQTLFIRKSTYMKNMVVLYQKLPVGITSKKSQSSLKKL